VTVVLKLVQILIRIVAPQTVVGVLGTEAMDRWRDRVKNLPLNPPAPAPRQVRVARNLSDEIKDLAIITARLTMSLAARSREHDAALQTVALISDHSSVSAAIKAAGQQYSKDAANHKMPTPPHIHIWAAAIQEALKSTNASEEDRAILHMHAASTGTPEELLDTAHCARFTRAFAPEMNKLRISVAPFLQPVLAALMRVLKSDGAIIKHGAAARNADERKLSDTLTNLNVWQRTNPGQENSNQFKFCSLLVALSLFLLVLAVFLFFLSLFLLVFLFSCLLALLLVFVA